MMADVAVWAFVAYVRVFVLGEIKIQRLLPAYRPGPSHRHPILVLLLVRVDAVK